MSNSSIHFIRPFQDEMRDLQSRKERFWEVAMFHVFCRLVRASIRETAISINANY